MYIHPLTSRRSLLFYSPTRWFQHIEICPWSTEPKHRVIALLRWRPLGTGHWVFREISTFLRDNDYKLYIRPEKRQGPSAVSREVSAHGQSTVSNDQN